MRFKKTKDQKLLEELNRGDGSELRKDIRGRAFEFKKTLQRQEQDFSFEQNLLMDLFGQGPKIWGLGEESGCQVQLNQTLFSGRTETGNLFGMGEKQPRYRPRTGLF